MQWEEPSEANRYLQEHARLLQDSYHQLTGRGLLPPDLQGEVQRSVEAHEVARQLFEAPFALVSHNTASDPVFNYANRTALRLFEMSWREFTSLPSRLSAEPLFRDERARLMATVRQKGFIDDYSGVRISKEGRRFMIEQATVWNLLDAQEVLRGQAALFDHWIFL